MNEPRQLVARIHLQRDKIWYQDFACGSAAALCDISITFPLYKLMFRQQLHGIKAHSALQQVRNEGIRFLYRGFLPPALQKTMCRSIMFGMYEKYRCHLYQSSGSDSNLLLHNLTWINVLAAALAGCTEAFVAAPLERVQALLQTSRYHAELKNTGHAFVVMRTYGVREYYRGLTAILLRNGPSNILFFQFREPLKHWIPRELGGNNYIGDFIVGACLGCAISAVFFPLNVVKARMQSQLGGPFPNPYRILLVVLRERDFKLHKLFRGVHLSYTRSMVGWGLTNTAYEFFETYFFNRNDRDS